MVFVPPLRSLLAAASQTSSQLGLGLQSPQRLLSSRGGGERERERESGWGGGQQQMERIKAVAATVTRALSPDGALPAREIAAAEKAAEAPVGGVLRNYL